MEKIKLTEVYMADSILDTTKRQLGIEPDVDAFDDALLVDINTALSMLYQLGVGPEGGLYVSDRNVTWDELFDGDNRLSMVKNYVSIKVRELFDPPASSSVSEAMNRVLKEIEWRILAVTDYGPGGGGGTEVVDEVARAAIRDHANDDSIHQTREDIDARIDNINVIQSKL